MYKSFVRACIIRALRTVCQTALATIGTATVMGEVSWSMVASASLLAGIVSVLMSVATGLPEAKEDRDDS